MKLEHENLLSCVCLDLLSCFPCDSKRDFLNLKHSPFHATISIESDVVSRNRRVYVICFMTWRIFIRKGFLRNLIEENPILQYDLGKEP